MLRLRRLALRLRVSRLRAPTLLNGLLVSDRTGRDIARGLYRTLTGHSRTGLLGLLKPRGLLRARCGSALLYRRRTLGRDRLGSRRLG